MRIGIVFNVVNRCVHGDPRDLASDAEMTVIPQLVQTELERRGHVTDLVPADFAMVAVLRRFGADLALNLAEGFGGTNADEHLIPALLDYSGVPYTGADAAAMLILRDKVFTKNILAAHGV